jgi:multidrug transporter EmrE-like cation transporter
MLPILMVFAVLAFTVYGQLMMKARALVHAAPVGDGTGRLQYLISMFSDIGVLSSFGAAVLAAVCWMLAIERLEVGYAFPFMALSFVLVPLGSMVLFGERMPPMQLLGLGLIVAGVSVSAFVR